MAIKSGLRVAFKALMGQINSLTAMQNELSGEKKIHWQHHERPKPQPWSCHWGSYELMLTLSVSSSVWTDIIEANILWHIIRMLGYAVYQLLQNGFVSLLCNTSRHKLLYDSHPYWSPKYIFFSYFPRYYLSDKRREFLSLKPFLSKLSKIMNSPRAFFLLCIWAPQRLVISHF